MNPFKRSVRRARGGAAELASARASELGRGLVAVRLSAGDVMPGDSVPADAGLVLVLFDAGGRARRSLGPALGPGGNTAGKLALDAGESAFCFHPGPYDTLLVPFAAAPELGLRLRFVIDAADPRVEQQRFHLFLHSEAGERLTLEALAASLQAALRLELGQGNLALPPCTALDEWDAFRAGLNELLYTRFGLTVEDCLPADLGDEVDFAALLAHKAQAVPVPTAPAPVSEFDAGAAVAAIPTMAAASAPASIHAPVPVDVAALDARALRRLFLELPAATGALRLIALPPGQAWFAARQAILARLDLASLRAATMPSLAWEAPDRPLAFAQQRRRAAACVAACAALDEAWALLARWRPAAQDEAVLPALFDEAGRILSNLDEALAARHAALAPLAVDESVDASRDAAAPAPRREPT